MENILNGNLPFCIRVFLFFILIKRSENSALPDQTGGYRIVLAIQENVPDFTGGGSLLFIQNVQTALETFSSKLWEASRGYFYIKDVDILVPSNWTLPNVNYSTDQNYNSANLRISSTAERPFALNTYSVCAKPGQYIELPLSFFNSSVSSSFGPHWKALLNLWATYRWGVQDEHGYIGNFKFPYSYKNDNDNQWQVTSCSDHPILGRFENINNSALQCTALDTLDSSSACRFVPQATGQTATTSLMNFHWIESVVNFCDESNHNILSPNRQNSICDHKSVWEVIRETLDYKSVISPVNGTSPPVTFNIVRHNPKPILYILLDKGLVQGSVSLANQIPRSIANLLGDVRRSATVAAVRSFPSNGGSVIDRDVEWSPIEINLDKFLSVVGSIRTDGPLERDFTKAIMAAIDEIKTQDHPNGVVMLVLKYGADLNNFQSYIPESDVLQALNEQGIILNSIELAIHNHSGHAHLSELAKQTGGLHTVLSNYGEAETSLGHVFNFVHKLLDANETFSELQRNFRTIIRTNTVSGSSAIFRVPKSENSSGKVQAYFSTSDSSLNLNNLKIEGINSSSGIVNPVTGITFSKHQDWLEQGSKWTYRIDFPNDKIVPYTDISFQTNCAACQGNLLVRTNIAEESKENVTVEVFTSIDGSSADLSNNDPIILFVKILKSEIPVVNARVIASITDIGSGRTTEKTLDDNGEGNPDSQLRDGIYSGYFIPDHDGSYRISLLVRGGFTTKTDNNSSPNLEALQTAGSNRLLPVDQGDMGCGAARCGEILGNVLITGTSNYSPEPTKIHTFFTSPDTQSDNVRLTWLAPSVPGRLFSVSSYDVRQSTDRASLVLDFENQTPVAGIPVSPAAPESLEVIILPKPTLTTYYAIRSVYRGKYSKISDVAVVEDYEAISSTPSVPTMSTDPSDPTMTTNPSDPTMTTNPSDSTMTTNPSDPTMTTNPTSTSPVPQTSSTKKPWVKKPVGIVIITISVLIVVGIIALLGYRYWVMRNSDRGKITPPEEVSRASIPQ